MFDANCSLQNQLWWEMGSLSCCVVGPGYQDVKRLFHDLASESEGEGGEDITAEMFAARNRQVDPCDRKSLASTPTRQQLRRMLSSSLAWALSEGLRWTMDSDGLR